jgi:hypothetical protein
MQAMETEYFHACSEDTMHHHHSPQHPSYTTLARHSLCVAWSTVLLLGWTYGSMLAAECMHACCVGGSDKNKRELSLSASYPSLASLSTNPKQTKAAARRRSVAAASGEAAHWSVRDGWENRIHLPSQPPHCARTFRRLHACSPPSASTVHLLPLSLSTG